MERGDKNAFDRICGYDAANFRGDRQMSEAEGDLLHEVKKLTGWSSVSWLQRL